MKPDSCQLNRTHKQTRNYKLIMFTRKSFQSNNCSTHSSLQKYTKTLNFSGYITYTDRHLLQWTQAEFLEILEPKKSVRKTGWGIFLMSIFYLQFYFQQQILEYLVFSLLNIQMHISIFHSKAAVSRVRYLSACSTGYINFYQTQHTCVPLENRH